MTWRVVYGHYTIHQTGDRWVSKRTWLGQFRSLKRGPDKDFSPESSCSGQNLSSGTRHAEVEVTNKQPKALPHLVWKILLIFIHISMEDAKSPIPAMNGGKASEKADGQRLPQVGQLAHTDSSQVGLCSACACKVYLAGVFLCSCTCSFKHRKIFHGDVEKNPNKLAFPHFSFGNPLVHCILPENSIFPEMVTMLHLDNSLWLVDFKQHW